MAFGDKLLTDNTTLTDALKKLIENMHPDLQTSMRLSLLGKVVKVYEDDYRVDVVIGEDPDILALPDIPVNSLFAQNGYGVWALPEIDAEVTVSFYEGDVTKPYVEAPIFYNNKSPQGFKTGSMALVGKHGQKMIFSPDKSEISIIADNIKTIRTGANNEVTIGDETKEIAGNINKQILGNKKTQIKGADIKESKTSIKKVSGLSEEEHGRRKVKIKGSSEKKIMGNSTNSTGGNLNEKVLGNKQSTVVGAKQQIVGGSYSLLIANGPVPQPVSWSVSATTGNISLNTMAGMIQLGGKLAISPAVLGTELVVHLTSLIQILLTNAAVLTVPVAVGAPAQLSPVVITALEAWLTGLSNILSQCIMLKKLPAG